jgi:Fe-S-cluster containining protein
LIGDILAHPEQQIHAVMRQAVEEFPFEADSEGVCVMLKDNRCSVYDSRPLLCNVEALGKLMGVNPTAWRQVNAAACNTIIDQLGLDPMYKIDAF